LLALKLYSALWREEDFASWGCAAKRVYLLTLLRFESIADITGISARPAQSRLTLNGHLEVRRDLAATSNVEFGGLPSVDRSLGANMSRFIGTATLIVRDGDMPRPTLIADEVIE
jgi:hypothetical protein